MSQKQNNPGGSADARQLKTDTPTYNELLNEISDVQAGRAPRAQMKPEMATRGSGPVQAAPADEAHTPVDANYPGVNRAAAGTAFTAPADDAVLARETDGKIPLPSYAAQGLDDYPVPPDNALVDNEADNVRHDHRALYDPGERAPKAADTRRERPLDAYPSGNSAPYYSAPEEGDGPGTPTEAQRAGLDQYDASPDDLTLTDGQ